MQEYLIPDADWVPGDKTQSRPGQIRAIYPDSTIVATTIQGSSRLAQSIIDPITGVESFTQPFYYLHSLSGDAVKVQDMTFDANGNLWVLTLEDIQICDQNGRVRAILRLPLGFDASTLDISDGMVILTDSDGLTFQRRFNVAPPLPGVTPKPQGQA